jgi:uncharacterized protein (TIGR00369 family)
MANVLTAWERATRLPGGARLFSLVAGRVAPYSGTLGARVEALAPGHARVRMPDRRRLRNHLRSVHAMALANLAEMTGNLALMAALPDASNMIPTGFSIEYVKKARGEVVATGSLGPVDAARGEIEWRVEIRDGGGAVVATAKAPCRLRPGTTVAT